MIRMTFNTNEHLGDPLLVLVLTMPVLEASANGELHFSSKDLFYVLNIVCFCGGILFLMWLGG